jgi:hypothetical protein
MQLRSTGAEAAIGAENVFGAEPRIGDSLQAAMHRAEELRSAGPA